MTDLQALKEAANAATPGKWRFSGMRNSCYSRIKGDFELPVIKAMPNAGVPLGEVQISEADVAYIEAACPDNILALIAEFEAMKEELNKLRPTGTEQEG